MRIGFLFLLILGLFAGTAHASHPPAGKGKQPPTKATKDIAEAKRLLELAKKKQMAAGKYRCCIKPVAPSKTAGCELCLRVHGTCNCAENLKNGKGVCGQCLASWKAGQGAISGIKKEEVILLPAPEQKVAKADADVPELTTAREAINRAKRILVSEGRFNCCIGDGGCDECALEGNCPCGVELNEGAEGEGVCGSCYDGWHHGQGSFEGVPVASVKLSPHQMEGMAGMGHQQTLGMFGDWRMNREGSGTSWLPDSSPMYAQMSQWGGFQTMLHGYGYGVYTDQGRYSDKRGDSRLYASSQIMGMAWKRTGKGIVGGRLMLSGDPITQGERGYPLLFQTGETANGQPLIDRQHPHDLFMELAATYTHRLTPNGGALSVYLAPVGEPAIGPTAFAHRPSAFDNPEAPISHHWFDATHITYGVATVGLASRAVKLEGSIFTGKEPDENRYAWDGFRWDSRSIRLSANPTRDLSLQVSQAYLRKPEALEPDTDQRRYTASVVHNLPISGGKENVQTSLMWARNRKYTTGERPHNSDGLLLESAFLGQQGSIFGRWESVDKDELFPDAEEHQSYRVNKFTLGGVKNLGQARGTDLGIGASVSAYSLPDALQTSYGSSPLSFNVYLRLRTSKMAH